MRFLIIIAGVFWSELLQAECRFCVSHDQKIISKLESFKELNANELLKKIESEGIKIEILNSHKQVPALGQFSWGKMRKAKIDIEKVSQIEGLKGKTICPNEHPLFSKSKISILLASDSPRETLIHEYLHTWQIRKDLSWCPSLKRMWLTKPSEEEQMRINQMEKDVYETMWSLREKILISHKDRAVLADGYLKYADVEMKQLLTKEREEFLRLYEEEKKVTIENYLSFLIELKYWNLCAQNESFKSCSPFFCEKFHLDKCHSEHEQFVELLETNRSPGLLESEEGEVCQKLAFRESSCLKKAFALHPNWWDRKIDIPKLSSPLPMKVDNLFQLVYFDNPFHFASAFYCIFKHKNSLGKSTDIIDFAYTVQGASLSISDVDDYFKGKIDCSVPSRKEFDKLFGEKKFLIAINNVAFLPFGRTKELNSNQHQIFNHERLHVTYDQNEQIKERVKSTWKKLTRREQERFLNEHSSYNLKNEDVLYKEYFSFRFESNPKAGEDFYSSLR